MPGANWKITFLIRDDGLAGSIHPNASNVVAEAARTTTFGNTATADRYSGFIYNITNGPLPVTLTNFTAKAENSFVNLNWSTSDETNNEYFEIQRSVNARDFEALGRISGNKNSTIQKDYYFTDIQPVSGINYYRLKQVDTDGTFSFSRIISANVSEAGTNDFDIFPNPSSDKVTVTNLREGSKIELWEINGKLNSTFVAKSISCIIEAKGLTKGMKVIRVLNQDGSSSAKKLMIN